MRRLVLLALSAALLACPPEAPNPMRRVSTGRVAVYHDDERGVTCWKVSSGLSCLPDSAFTVPR